MNILTGNDLLDGRVVWWTGDAWSRSVADAVDVGEKGEAIAEQQVAAQAVSEAWVVPAEAGDNGPVPSHIKERVRALGPTVRPDLTLDPNKAEKGDWVVPNV